MALKTWDLLPCTEMHFDQEMVSLTNISEVWDPATVYVCECMDADMNETIVFAVSMGRLASNPQVGDGYEVRDYDTRRSIGTFTVMNIVTVKGGKITKKVNERFLHDDAPVMVFK